MKECTFIPKLISKNKNRSSPYKFVKKVADKVNDS
jgi:hypothetical protein